MAEKEKPFQYERVISKMKGFLFRDMILLHLTIKGCKADAQAFRSLCLIAVAVLQNLFYMIFFNRSQG